MPLNVWSVLGEMKLDTTGFKRGLDDATKTGNKAAGKIEKDIGGAAKRTESSLDKAAKAAGGFVKELQDRPIKAFSSATERMRMEVEAGLRPMKDLQRELKDQERALRETAKAQDKNSQEYRATIVELTRVRAELATTTGQINTQRAAIDRLAEVSGKIGRTMTMRVTAPILAAGTAAITAAVKLGNYADRMLDLEQITGVSVTTLQEFENVARVAGVSTDVFNKAAEGLTRRLRATGTESQEFTDNLKLLGVETRDAATGALRSMDNLLPEIITKLQGMEAGATRNSIAMQVLGRSGTDLAPVLGMTADQFERARVEAHEMGQVLDRDALNAANNFRIEWEQLRAELGLAGRDIQTALVPAMGTLVGFMRDDAVPVIKAMAERVANLIEWWSGLPDILKKGTVAIIAIGAAAGPAAIAISGLARAFMLMTGPVGWAALAVTTILGLALAFSGKPDSLDRSINDVTKALAGGDPDTLTGALDDVIKQVDGPVKTVFQEMRDDLVKTGDVGVEQMQRIARAADRAKDLVAAQRELAEAQQVLSDARTAEHAFTPGVAAAERLELLRDSLSRSGRTDLAQQIRWNPERQSFGFPEGFSPGRMDWETTELIALATRAVRGEGDNQVARIKAAEETVAEKQTAFDRILAEINKPTTPTGTPTATPTGTGLPSPTDVQNQADEIVGIINTLNADLAKLRAQRDKASSTEELAALNAEIAKKQEELAYYQSITVTDLTTFRPRATVTPAKPLAAPTPTGMVAARSDRGVAQLRGAAASIAPTLIPLLEDAQTLTLGTLQGAEAAIRIVASLNATTAAGTRAAEERRQREEAFLTSTNELERFQRNAASLTTIIQAANDQLERLDQIDAASARFQGLGRPRRTDAVTLGPVGAAAARQQAAEANTAHILLNRALADYERGAAGIDDVRAAVKRLTDIAPLTTKEVNDLTDNVLVLAHRAEHAAKVQAFDESPGSAWQPIGGLPANALGQALNDVARLTRAAQAAAPRDRGSILDQLADAIITLTEITPMSVKQINELTGGVLRLGGAAEQSPVDAFDESPGSAWQPDGGLPPMPTGPTQDELDEQRRKEMEERAKTIAQLTTVSADDGPIAALGHSLMGLAAEKIPLLGAALDGFVQAGPMGAIVAVFAELVGRTEAFSDIMAMLDDILAPIVAALDMLLTALKPIIEVAIALFQSALQPLVIIIEKVLAPVITFVARLIAGAWNAIATAINWALGWLGVSLPLIDVDGEKTSGSSGLIADLEAKRNELLKQIAEARTEREISDLNRRLEAVDEELARLRGLGKTAPPSAPTPETEALPWTFTSTAPTIQFAVATPLVEAAQSFLVGATAIQDTFSPTAPGMTSIGRFTNALADATPVLRRLTERGIQVAVNLAPTATAGTEAVGALR